MTAILRAVRESDLTSNQRLLVMTITGLANPTTGVIPEAYRPGRHDLIEYTGLGRSSVTRTLREIEDAGWIERPRTSDRKAAIVAVLIPSKARTEPNQDQVKAHTEPNKAHTEPSKVEDDDELRPTQSPLRPTGGPPKAHTRPDTYIHGPYGPTGQNTDALFDPPSPSPTPTANKRRAPSTEEPPEFAAWWSTYPRKTDRKRALKAWTAAVRRGNAPAMLADAAARFAAHHAERRTAPDYIPHPTTWLNGDRWNDQLTPAASSHTGHRPFQNPDPAGYYGDL